MIAGLDIVNKAQSTALASAACIIKLVFNHVKPHLSSAKQSRAGRGRAKEVEEDVDVDGY